MKAQDIAASVYENIFVPSLFEEWSYRALERARIHDGSSVLDVACGTGVVARVASTLIGSENVVGVDIDDGMLALAKQKAPAINWQLGSAENLPFPDDSFDHAINQFGLMFVGDKEMAIREMLRVVRPGGTIVIVVWANLSETPGYFRVERLLEEMLGPKGGRLLDLAYSLGSEETLLKLLLNVGITDATIEKVVGSAKYHSLELWLDAEFKDWIDKNSLDKSVYPLFFKKASILFRDLVKADNSVCFEKPAHIITIDV